jgi:hypothetical protein
MGALVGAFIPAWLNRDVEAQKAKAESAIEAQKEDSAAALARADFETRLILKARFPLLPMVV